MGYTKNESIALSIYTYGDYAESEAGKEVGLEHNQQLPSKGLYVIVNNYYNTHEFREHNVAEHIGKHIFEVLGADPNMYAEEALEHSTYLDLFEQVCETNPSRLLAGYDITEMGNKTDLYDADQIGTFDDHIGISDATKEETKLCRESLDTESNIKPMPRSVYDYMLNVDRDNIILIAGGCEAKWTQIGIELFLKQATISQQINIVPYGFNRNIEGLTTTLFTQVASEGINQLFNLKRVDTSDIDLDEMVDSVVDMIKNPKRFINKIIILYGYDIDTEQFEWDKKYIELIRKVFNDERLAIPVYAFNVSKTAFKRGEALRGEWLK